MNQILSNLNSTPKSTYLGDLWESRYLILVSVLLLCLAGLITYLAGSYVLNVKGVAANDLVLDFLPTLNFSMLYLYGAIIVFAILIIYPMVHNIKKFHEVLCQISFLVMTRAVFTMLTHLSIPTDALQFNVPSILSFLNFQNDLFFSGHTAIPFLGFLMFKGKIRYFFLAASIMLGATVLFMHVHYTIDVLSAFFITYGTFKIGKAFFDRINYGK